MRFLRPFDLSAAFDTGYRGYRAQFLANFESALFIASTIQEGGCGPSLHYHLSDQLYFLMRGLMTVRLGNEQHRVGASTLVYIPAGLAHCNWNEGSGAETHLEMIIPAPTPGAQIAILVDDPDDVPAARRANREGYVRRVTQEELTEPLPGFFLHPLADPGTGVLTTVVNYCEVAPGRGGPRTHVHDFDQFYLVTEGELTVEVALERHVARPETLVLLPAGVPHRQYNEGKTTEKHLAILAPPPLPDRPWDVGVQLSVDGETHSGSFTPSAPGSKH